MPILATFNSNLVGVKRFKDVKLFLFNYPCEISHYVMAFRFDRFWVFLEICRTLQDMNFFLVGSVTYDVLIDLNPNKSVPKCRPIDANIST